MSQENIARFKEEILNYGGLPPYDATTMAKCLSFSPEDLDDWRNWKRVIALPMSDGTLLYPRWQLNSKWPGSLLYGLGELLRAAPDDPWGIADILTHPQIIFDGRTPIEMLNFNGGRSPEVIRKTIQLLHRAYDNAF